MSKSTSELPEEMIREVFLRLPVKSLLVCKSVCKPWLSTISSPNFIKSHLHHVLVASRKNPTLLEILSSDYDDCHIEFSEYLLLLIERLEQRRLQHLFEALLDVSVQDLSTSPIRIHRIRYEQRVASSCHNGIICVADVFENLYLWNPSIRQCKKLPFPPKPCTDTMLEFNFGFGYDSISDDYKVIRLFDDLISDGLVPVLQVYSSNADSWTEFHPPIVDGELPDIEANIVINGVLYFTVGDNLLSFDFRKQVFVPFPFPTSTASIRTMKSNILDFKGSVAIVFQSGTGVDLWTLEDVSGEVLWTKKFSIEVDFKLDMRLSFYLGAGQFYGEKLIDKYPMYNFLYDSEEKVTKYYRLGESDINTTLNYTETLVSLEGFDRVESFNGFVQVE